MVDKFKSLDENKLDVSGGVGWKVALTMTIATFLAGAAAGGIATVEGQEGHNKIFNEFSTGIGKAHQGITNVVHHVTNTWRGNHENPEEGDI